MSASIYYFSGTGNSYRVAKTISENMDIKNVELINIAQRKNHEHDNSKGMLGFVFPVYYFGLPVIVEDFIKQLEIPQNAYVFIVVTRGQPLAGGAKRQIDKLFREKGRTYHFFRYITMGNNYPFYFFNGSKDRLKESRNHKADITALAVATAVNAKKQSKVFSILDYPPFPTIMFKLPTFGYKHFLQIYNQDSCFIIDENQCNKCKKCVRVCPTNNIEFHSKVVWKHENCQMCLACYNCCPKNAIQYIDPLNKVDTNGKRQYWNFDLNDHRAK
jgi:NAD-dependent dihydropyrimidine dehydrogenase PreA subunit/flavodoxin